MIPKTATTGDGDITTDLDGSTKNRIKRKRLIQHPTTRICRIASVKKIGMLLAMAGTVATESLSSGSSIELSTLWCLSKVGSRPSQRQLSHLSILHSLRMFPQRTMWTTTGH